ncbi:MAG TPA: hypothetical protein VLE47_03460 [Candidatus Saccharimonadales bacterium]|nr:hypothetical protein [Candidatus Saccharimonadales bacterium]
MKIALLIIDLLILLATAGLMYFASGLAYSDGGNTGTSYVWTSIIPIIFGIILVALFLFGRKNKVANKIYLSLGLVILCLFALINVVGTLLVYIPYLHK